MAYSSVCSAQTPHRLLWDSGPEEGKTALKIMTNDPSWVTKRDSDSQTPLHVAARFNHIEVVKWLLENGADVDAQAYNRFTPLHLTKKG
jgi:ankyrin repeat protein